MLNIIDAMRCRTAFITQRGVYGDGPVTHASSAHAAVLSV
jgi:hypothetical protein